MIKKGVLIVSTMLLLFALIDSSFAVILDDGVSSNDFENSTEFILRHEDTLSLALRSNPSTGYEWNYSAPLGDVELLDHEFLEDNSYIEAVGVGGNDYYEFKINQKGLSILEFDYSRPWEDSKICTKKYVILAF